MSEQRITLRRGADCPEEMWPKAIHDVVEWRWQDGTLFGLCGYRTLVVGEVRKYEAPWEQRAEELVASEGPYATFGAFDEWAGSRFEYFGEWDDMDTGQRVAIMGLCYQAIREQQGVGQ